MKTSETITEICKALVGFHSEVGRISKDGTNPHLKNRYATIDQIIEEIRPILATHGLFIMQMPTNTEAGEIRMTTRIYHTSGQWMESPTLTLKPQKQDAQGIGSAVTYARRYSLTSFLSLNTGEDDDGCRASAREARTATKPNQKAKPQPKTNPKPQPQQQPKPEPSKPEVIDGNLASEPQRRKIFAMAKEKTIPESVLRGLIRYYTGKESTKSLSKQDASDLIKLLDESETSEIYQLIGARALDKAVNG